MVICRNGLPNPTSSGNSTTRLPVPLQSAMQSILLSCAPNWSQSAPAGFTHSHSSRYCHVQRHHAFTDFTSCSDKPVALCASDSQAKAKELQEWSAQLDRIDELVHTREELRAYSPPPSRFNDIPYSCRSYSPIPTPASTCQYLHPPSSSSTATSLLHRSYPTSLCGRVVTKPTGLGSQTWSMHSSSPRFFK